MKENILFRELSKTHVKEYVNINNKSSCGEDDTFICTTEPASRMCCVNFSRFGLGYLHVG